MNYLPSNKLLMKKYCLTEKQLLDAMHKCVSAFLSEEELSEFLYECYHKQEMRLGRRAQK